MDIEVSSPWQLVSLKLLLKMEKEATRFLLYL